MNRDCLLTFAFEILSLVYILTHGKLANNTHRHSQDFVWGALFFPQKVDAALFLVIALKTQAKTA